MLARSAGSPLLKRTPSQAGSQPDGFGLAVWDTVRKYDGQWQGGWEHGLGREAFYDGSCYGGTSPHKSLILLLLGSKDILRGLEGDRDNRGRPGGCRTVVSTLPAGESSLKWGNI